MKSEKTLLFIPFFFIAFTFCVSAFTLDAGTQVQPNASSSGYYVINKTTVVDELYVNSTHAVFTHLAGANRTVFIIAADESILEQLCIDKENCTINQTSSVKNILFRSPFTIHSSSISPTETYDSPSDAVTVTATYNASSSEALLLNCTTNISDVEYKMDYSATTALYTKRILASTWDPAEYIYIVNCSHQNYTTNSSQGVFIVRSGESGGPSGAIITVVEGASCLSYPCENGLLCNESFICERDVDEDLIVLVREEIDQRFADLTIDRLPDWAVEQMTARPDDNWVLFLAVALLAFIARKNLPKKKEGERNIWSTVLLIVIALCSLKIALIWLFP